MSKKQEIFETIESHYNDFVENHNGTTKASQTRARKSIGEIKKLLTEHRKPTVVEQRKDLQTNYQTTQKRAWIK